jgi:histidinol dehydrogenase
MIRYLKAKTPDTIGSKISQDAVSTVVKGVIDKIRSQGDVAVRQYSENFDKWSPSSFKLSNEEIEKIISTVPEQTIKDIKEVQANIREFAIAQRNSLKDFELEIQPGVFLGQKANPITAVGT